MEETIKKIDLHLNNDAEWQCLKMALCHLHYLSSCFEVLESYYIVSHELLKRIGVWCIPNELGNIIEEIKKSFDLHFNNDAEWKCLKMALFHLHYFSSCYEVLQSDYIISSDLLKRIGVWYIPDSKGTELVIW